MDIEEIKCPLCNEVYDESDHLPVLLPDCGHSYCISCANFMFTDLQKQNEADGTSLPFTCPEDGEQCSMEKAEALPKNFALLKIVKKTLEAIKADESLKKTEEGNPKVSLRFNSDEQEFEVQETSEQM